MPSLFQQPASSYALACDLLGRPPDEGPDRRVSLAEALRSCPAGQVMAAADGDLELAVCVLEDGRAFAMPDWCPHDGGRLSDGFVEAGRLVCGRHGWEFDPATGQRVGQEPVPEPCEEPGCQEAGLGTGTKA